LYEYVHGGNIYAVEDFVAGEFLDFSANINPLGLPETVKAAVSAAMQECVNYPDPYCRKLRAALAQHEKMDPENIFCGNGASEIIFRLALAVKPQKALILAPTFADYERALQTVGCVTQYYTLSAETEFRVEEDYLSYLNTALDMIFICNPNNPTGQLCEKSFLKEVIAQCQKNNTRVVVDECFIDFIDNPEAHSVQEYIDDFPNLIILKAFTKIYAMPGIRLGYALTSDHSLLDKLKLAGPDWSVSTIAQAAGIAALKQKDYVQQARKMIKAERTFLCEALGDLGFTVYGSHANYIFFQAAGILDLAGRLLTQKVLIRSCANYRDLNSQFYRVAVKNKDENRRLIQSIKDVLV